MENTRSERERERHTIKEALILTPGILHLYFMEVLRVV